MQVMQHTKDNVLSYNYLYSITSAVYCHDTSMLTIYRPTTAGSNLFRPSSYFVVMCID